MTDQRIRQYVVDAFTDRVFRGNQAAICVLDRWLPEKTMMDITLENNFSETAFVVRNSHMYDLRWFTPGGEIDLCGHATLAARLSFSSYTMVFPSASTFIFIWISSFSGIDPSC